MFLRFLLDDSGQGVVEYALIISCVALAAVASMKLFGAKVSNSLSNSAAQLK